MVYGGVAMTHEEHSRLLCEAFERANREFDALPEDQKREVAKRDLIKVGFLNPDGTIAEPYAEFYDLP